MPLHLYVFLCDLSGFLYVQNIFHSQQQGTGTVFHLCEFWYGVPDEICMEICFRSQVRHNGMVWVFHLCEFWYGVPDQI